jgi:hypothetical protein
VAREKRLRTTIQRKMKVQPLARSKVKESRKLYGTQTPDEESRIGGVGGEADAETQAFFGDGGERHCETAERNLGAGGRERPDLYFL